MKNKLSLFLLILVAAVSINSCKDVIETDLSKSSITIDAPSNNITVSISKQLFKWEEVKGAISYQLQIVNPKFDSVVQFILDTTIKVTQYSYILQSGHYQWRVRAKNGSSNTDYVTYNLKIDSSLNIANESVPLSTPVDKFYSNKLTNTFTWQTLPNASYYTFHILVNGTPIISKDTTATTMTYTFIHENTYQWNVLAYNSSSNSTTSGSNIRTITIDTTKPAIPVITLFPLLNDTTSKNPVPLTWNSVESGAIYEVRISSDSIFSTIVKDDTTSNLIYNFSSATIGQLYYWQVRAKDAATNASNYSIKRRFKRQ